MTHNRNVSWVPLVRVRMPLGEYVEAMERTATADATADTFLLMVLHSSFMQSMLLHQDMN